MRLRSSLALTIGAALLAIVGIQTALSDGWGNPVRIESIPGTSPDFNFEGLDGCPIESPDGLSFYIASDRPGGEGGIDIWRASRSSTGAPWGAPVNLGAPVNSSANDFCPTPIDDGRLFFVSTRDGGCGAGDIYYVKPTDDGGWSDPVNIDCEANSEAMEFSPSLVDLGADGTVLFFSSARAGGFAPEAAEAVADHDIYYSRLLSDGSFGPATLVNEVNSAADDARPNVRLDGLEMVFDSTRPGTLGGPDIWVSTRPTVEHSWSAPVHLPAPINSEGGESRASLSSTGERLYFGSTRPGGDGGSDVYVSTRGTSLTSPTITPPSTGDAGLVEGMSYSGAGLFLVLAAGLLTAGGLRSRRVPKAGG